MDHPKDVGDRATLAIMLALRVAGYGLLLPFGENTRYDLVIDDGERLGRVQCKSGRLRQGAVRFKTSSSYAHHDRPKMQRRDYLGQVDYFAVYCRDTAGVYLVPIEDIQTKCEGALRVDPPRNGQTRRIRNASDYLLHAIEIGKANEAPLRLLA